MVEHLGIEPSVPEAADLQSAESPLILLLRNTLVPLDRIELTTHDYKSSVIPFN